MVSVTWPQVLGWRMRRQYLDSPTDDAVAGIVARLCGVQAQVGSAAGLAVAVRQSSPDLAAIDRALWEDRSLVKTWAMRGTLHLLPVADAGAYLSLIAEARTWERGSWQKAFGATPAEVAALTDAVAAVLDDRVLTREELVAEVVNATGSSHLEELLRSGWGTLLKPVAWQGFLCHGPPDGARVTFTRPDTWFAHWHLPRPEEAAPIAIRAYLRAHGPATPDAFDAWLSRGATKKSRLREWFAAMADELTTVDIQGRQAYLLAQDVDELVNQHPSSLVRLLPGFDQYVLGPGTGDDRVVPAGHRADVSRTAGWISPVVIADGRVVGVWNVANGADSIAVSLWEDVDRVQLDAEIARLSTLIA